jgi:hydrogenase maturation protein HypF
MELEMIQGRDPEVPYGIELERTGPLYQIRPRSIIRGVVDDLRRGTSGERISRRFHLTLVEAFVQVCIRIREDTGLAKVVLGGGVFQNRTLLADMEARLIREGFQVFSKRLVPTNDGGIAFGQAVAAHYLQRNRKSEPPSQPRDRQSGDGPSKSPSGRHLPSCLH